MTNDEIVQLMAYMGEMWPNWQQPASREQADLRVTVWWRLLGDLDQAHVIAAVDEHATAGEAFAPNPGMVRRRACELANPAAGAPEPIEAWAEVLAEIHRVGYTADAANPARFSHPAVADTVADFGWIYLCQSEDGMVDRAHFLKAYAAKVERLADRAATPPSVAALDAPWPVTLPLPPMGSALTS